MLNAVQLVNREHKVVPLKNGQLKIELNPQADKDTQLEYRKGNESYGLFDDNGNRVRLRTGNIRMLQAIKPLLAHSKTGKNSITFDCTQPYIAAAYKHCIVRVLGLSKNAMLYTKEFLFEDEEEY